MNTANEHVAHDEHEHPLVPYATYVKVWAALIVLTLVTVGAHYAHLRHMAVIVALMVATAKCTLVIMWFMHLKYESKLFTWFLISAVGAFATFLILTFADYSFR